MTAALAIVRFAHFCASLGLFGAAAFLAACAPPALRDALASRLRRAMAVAALLALASALAWLALESASLADDWGAAFEGGAWREVLGATAFGAVWSLRLGLLAALGLLTWRRPGAVAAHLTLAGFSLASLGLVGHAAMETGWPGAAHRAVHAVHLLAAGAWLGGLPPFLACLALSQGPLGAEAAAAMGRFSRLGHWVVAALIATGAANVAFIAPAAASPYVALLDAKIALAAAMVALALFNRYKLAPRLAAGQGAAAAAMRRTALAEVALGVGAVALVSVFGLLDPG